LSAVGFPEGGVKRVPGAKEGDEEGRWQRRKKARG
jgi:hypothetical protein